MLPTKIYIKEYMPTLVQNEDGLKKKRTRRAIGTDEHQDGMMLDHDYLDEDNSRQGPTDADNLFIIDGHN